MAITLTSNLGLVPQQRLGALLARRRELHGYSVADMARQSGGRFTESDLLAIESGTVSVNDAAIEALSLIYEFNSSTPTQSRSKLIIADDEEVPFGLASEAFDDALIETVLQRYLALLYLLRTAEVGEPLRLRTDDCAMLAMAFNATETDMTERLMIMMETQVEPISRQAELMRRRLVVPAAGLLVGPTPAGMLVLVK
jgi:transcriptional regulator with XRE-family HTH domain